MNHRRGGPLLLATLFAAFVWTLTVVATRRYQRFEVAGRSMSPAYNPGDWLLVDLHAYRHRLPLPGEAVIIRDVRQPARQLIKRIYRVSDDGQLDVRGDNSFESTDSRQFGLVTPSLLVGKVQWRFHREK